MTELKVWEFEEEWYVAESSADAEAARLELTGQCDEYEDDAACEVHGDRALRCYVELPASKWANGNGRGYLMGTNW